MITAVLAFIFLFSLSYGRAEQPRQLLFCLTVTILLAVLSRHKHTGVLLIDMLAQTSRLKVVSPTLKFWTLFLLIVVCVASNHAYAGLFLLAATIILAVVVGRLSLSQYLQIIVIPFSFLLIAGIVLLFEVSPEQAGVINIPIFGVWLSVSEGAQESTALTVSRALGAVSCLNLLSITTPMPDVIGVLRKARCPDLVIDLMYLIYRYIFILLSLLHNMRSAAGSRLGFKDYKTSVYTTGQIYANLMARSYGFASKNFDAMESRCYDSGIRFLEQEHKLSAMHILISAAIFIITVFLGFMKL